MAERVSCSEVSESEITPAILVSLGQSPDPDYSSDEEDKHKLKSLVPCSICKRTFRGVTGLKIHMKSHIDTPKFPCKFAGCGKKYKFIYNLALHYSNVHKESQPPSIKERTSELVIHIPDSSLTDSKISSDKEFSVVEIGKTSEITSPSLRIFDTITKSTTDVEERKHVETISIKSTEVNSDILHQEHNPLYSTSKNISLSTISDMYRFKCPECDAKFKSEFIYTHHVRSKHINPVIYSCVKCKRTYDTQIFYLNHLNTCNK